MSFNLPFDSTAFHNALIAKERAEAQAKELEEERSRQLAEAQTKKDFLIEEFKRLFPRFGSRLQPDRVDVTIVEIFVSANPGYGRMQEVALVVDGLILYTQRESQSHAMIGVALFEGHFIAVQAKHDSKIYGFSGWNPFVGAQLLPGLVEKMQEENDRVLEALLDQAIRLANS